MTTIEVTFLGTTAGVPTKKRNHASIHLRYQSQNEFSVLFDCGEGTQRQILHTDVNFMRIDHIFITHWHADHYAGLLGILETMNLEQRKKPLYVYGPEATKQVPLLLNIGYASKSFEIVPVDCDYESREPQTLLDEDEFYVESIPVKHRIPSVGFALVEKDRVRIDKEKARKLGLPAKGPLYKKLKDEGEATYKGKKVKLEDVSFTEKGKRVAYSGDTMPCDNMIKLAKDADLLIHDSTFFLDDEEARAEGYRHATFDQVLGIADKAGAKKLVLTHISRRYQNLKELEDKVAPHKNVRIARDFMKIRLK